MMVRFCFILKACKNSFCKVCCDHLQLQLIGLSKSETLGEKLQLNNDQGTLAIKNVVNSPTIERCKSRCSETYPLKLPDARPSPERDPTLGKEQNPAQSCADIKQWGRHLAPSGQYWIKSTKGIAQVFCDMETDGGGWTLFFNYRHLPGMTFNLNGTVREIFIVFRNSQKAPKTTHMLILITLFLLVNLILKK